MGGSSSDDGGNNEVKLEQMRQNERDRQAQQDRRADRRENRSDNRALERARAGGQSAIESYFNSQGVVPDAYGSDIQGVISEIMNMIPEGSDKPGTFFAGAPELAFNRAETAARNKAMTTLADIFPTNFERTRYESTLDDPILAAIEAEDRLDAERYIDNLFNRKVISEGGRAAAMRDLDRQGAGAKSRLNQWGTATIEEGRGGARDIANEARQGASTLRLGQGFDPYSFSSMLDTEFNDFLQNLEINIRGKKSGNLFDTTNLSTIAGAAQGAGNLAFNRNAVAGITEDNKDPSLDTNRLAGSSGIF